MSSELRRAKERYSAASDDACREAAKVVTADLGIEVHVTGWTNRAAEAYRAQWEPQVRHVDGDFDWPESFRKYREPGNLEMCIWVDQRLCGIALATMSGQAVRIEFMEREPDDACPLAGGMMALVLDAASQYAQRLGRRELRLHSVRLGLVSLYKAIGFVEVSPKGETPYLKRDV